MDGEFQMVNKESFITFSIILVAVIFERSNYQQFSRSSIDAFNLKTMQRSGYRCAGCTAVFASQTSLRQHQNSPSHAASACGHAARRAIVLDGQIPWVADSRSLRQDLSQQFDTSVLESSEVFDDFQCRVRPVFLILFS